MSTSDQRLDAQKDALKAAGCSRIFTDVAGGKRDDRPGLAKALDYLRHGDSLVIVKLDRLGRSLQHLVRTVCELGERDVELVSLNDAIDTGTPGGRLVFHVMCALAEYERELIVERTNAGLAAARARGRKGGRKPALSEEQRRMARTMYDSREHTVDQIASALKVSRATVYRAIEAERVAS